MSARQGAKPRMPSSVSPAASVTSVNVPSPLLMNSRLPSDPSCQPVTSRSRSPSRSTSPKADPKPSPIVELVVATPARPAISSNVPSPRLRYSRWCPGAAASPEPWLVTCRSVHPSPSKSAAAAPEPRCSTATLACAPTSEKVPSLLFRYRRSGPESAPTTKRSSQPSRSKSSTAAPPRIARVALALTAGSMRSGMPCGSEGVPSAPSGGAGGGGSSRSNSMPAVAATLEKASMLPAGSSQPRAGTAPPSSSSEQAAATSDTVSARARITRRRVIAL